MNDAPDVRGLAVGNHRFACPECNKGARDTALSVTIKGDGVIVWVCFRCGWKGAKHQNRPALVSVSMRARKPESRSDASLDVVRKIWKATIPLAGTLGADYLELRRCLLPPRDGDLRFHPGLYCADVKAELPALIGRVSTVIGNRAVGIHRIWIRQGEAKAVAKKRLGGASSEAVCIRLWPDDTVEAKLGIAEGVETALAAAHRLRPMWSTIDCGQMAKFPLLDGIASLTIFADFDDAGMKAATAAHERYFTARRSAQVVRSRIAGEDYNDVLSRTHA